MCVCVCVRFMHFCQITLKGIKRTTFVIYPGEAVFSVVLLFESNATQKKEESGSFERA